MSLPRPNESYHFQANLICWDSPFKGVKLHIRNFPLFPSSFTEILNFNWYTSFRTELSYYTLHYSAYSLIFKKFGSVRIVTMLSNKKVCIYLLQRNNTVSSEKSVLVILSIAIKWFVYSIWQRHLGFAEIHAEHSKFVSPCTYITSALKMIPKKCSWVCWFSSEGRHVTKMNLRWFLVKIRG